MPIDKSNTELTTVYYAVINEDGSYGEPIPLENCKSIKICWRYEDEEI